MANPNTIIIITPPPKKTVTVYYPSDMSASDLSAALQSISETLVPPSENTQEQ